MKKDQVLPDGYKIYKCTDCQHVNIKKDNGEIRVGFCDECEHPLWNPTTNDRGPRSGVKDMETGTNKEELLKRFMDEMFDLDELHEAGLFGKGKIDRQDYPAQAKRICEFMGFESIYEYGAREIRCHVTYASGKRPEGEPFVTVIPSIYES